MVNEQSKQLNFSYLPINAEGRAQVNAEAGTAVDYHEAKGTPLSSLSLPSFTFRNKKSCTRGLGHPLQLEVLNNKDTRAKAGKTLQGNLLSW